MKLNANIKISGMSGFGPTAWHQDHKILRMHEPIEQEHHQHHIARKTEPEHDETLVNHDVPRSDSSAEM